MYIVSFTSWCQKKNCRRFYILKCKMRKGTYYKFFFRSKWEHFFADRSAWKHLNIFSFHDMFVTILKICARHYLDICQINILITMSSENQNNAFQNHNFESNKVPPESCLPTLHSTEEAWAIKTLPTNWGMYKIIIWKSLRIRYVPKKSV